MKNILATSLSSKSNVDYEVQGKKASSYEAYVAGALTKLRLGFQFQYPIFGGRLFRGGQVIDFLVYTVPAPTALEIDEEYWHKDKAEEFRKDAELRTVLMNKGFTPEVKHLYGEDVETPEKAFESVRKAFFTAG